MTKTLLESLVNEACRAGLKCLLKAIKNKGTAARHATDVLRQPGDADEIALVFEAFLGQKGAAELLAAALIDQKLPADVAKMSFAVTIHEADGRKQNFGMVSNAFIRVINENGGTELARYDLSEDASTETAMIFGELYRNGAEWKFKAIGQGFAGGLGPLAKSFGVNI